MPTSFTGRSPTLAIGYEGLGDTVGLPIVLRHGFPDAARAWNAGPREQPGAVVDELLTLLSRTR